METLLKINEQLCGAPSGVLVAIFAIALGYLLKTLPCFDNKYIPLVVVLAASGVGDVVDRIGHSHQRSSL